MKARTFAIGDLHGEITLLRRLLGQIQLTAQDTLIFLGDYVDRGEDSVAVCQTLLELQQQSGGPRVVTLRGNHDAAWLEVWTGNGYRHCPIIPGARAIWEHYYGLPPAIIGRFLRRPPSPARTIMVTTAMQALRQESRRMKQAKISISGALEDSHGAASVLQAYCVWSL